MICHKTLVLVLFSIFLRCTSQQDVNGTLFSLNIVHLNDFHSRYQILYDGNEAQCCGYARIVNTVKRLLSEHRNSLYFNVGNYFAGRWYDLGRWEVTSSFLNKMPADAMTLGPHEFDHGIEGLVPFLESLRNTTMLVANMDSSREPRMRGQYQKSMIIERSNRKIGVIGVTTSEDQSKIGNIGNLVFGHEGAAVEEEAAKLESEGVNIIVVVSHCGPKVDEEIAKNSNRVDIIIGSNSDNSIPIGNEKINPFTPNGKYSTVVSHTSGHRVLIVQAGKYGLYVGQLMVKFDNDGEIIEFEGAPIYMNNTLPQDTEVKTLVGSWGDFLLKKAYEKAGTSLQTDIPNSNCIFDECALGNFLCDSMVDLYLDSTKNDILTEGLIAIINFNSFNTLVNIPTSIRAREEYIPYCRIAWGLPYKNTLTAFDLPGKRLLEALELGASTLVGGVFSKSSNFLQVAGLNVTYDLKKPAFERVIDIQVRCGNFSSPSYKSFSENSTYRILAPNSLIYGSDNFDMIRNYASNEQSFMVLSDALMSYIKKKSPINPVVEGRIKIRN